MRTKVPFTVEFYLITILSNGISINFFLVQTCVILHNWKNHPNLQIHIIQRMGQKEKKKKIIKKGKDRNKRFYYFFMTLEHQYF